MILKFKLINLLSKAIEINENYLEINIEQHWMCATPNWEKTKSHHFKYLIDEGYTEYLLEQLAEITDEIYNMGCQKQYHEGAELSMLMVKEISIILDRVNSSYLESSKRRRFKNEYKKLFERNTELIEELINAAQEDRVLSEKVLEWLMNDWCKISFEESIRQNDYTAPANLFENMFTRSETFCQVSMESILFAFNQFEPFPMVNVKRVFYTLSNNIAKLNQLLDIHKFYFNLHIYHILELANTGFDAEALKYSNDYGREIEIAYKELLGLSHEGILSRNLYFTSDEARFFIRWRYKFVYDTLISSKLYDEAIHFVLELFHRECENSTIVRFSVMEKLDYYKKLCEDLPLEKRSVLSNRFFQNAEEYYGVGDVRYVAAFENNWLAFLHALKNDFSIGTLFITYDEYKSELSKYPEELYNVIMLVIRNFVDKYAPNGIDKTHRKELIQGFKKLRTISKNDQLVFELVYEFKKSYPHRRVLAQDMDLYLKENKMDEEYGAFVKLKFKVR